MSDDSLQAELRALRAVPENDARMAAVRRAVLSRIETRRRAAAGLAYAASLAMLVAAAALWLRGPMTLPPLEPVVFDLPAAPQFAFVKPDRRPPVATSPPVRSSEIRVVSVSKGEGVDDGAASAMLELPSSNPKVVLYFLAESKGE